MTSSFLKSKKRFLQKRIDLSFVVIGYNEGQNLRSCFDSIRTSVLDGIKYEIIYVDGGSTDESLKIAKISQIDQILGGDKRRLAAENRNLGWRAAKGDFIHFLDGDMILDKDWAFKAWRFLCDHTTVAVVCGKIEELKRNVFYQVLELDWKQIEGEISYCGGAALWRKEILQQLNGFPEDVSSGEEPLLCYSVRNFLGLNIYKLKHRMVTHDLGFLNLNDIWRRHVRCGKGLAEISTRLFYHPEKLWLKETINALMWSCFFLFMIIIIILGSIPLKSVCLFILACVIARKTIQLIFKKHPFKISIIYALYVYLSKLPLGFGAISWYYNNLLRLSILKIRKILA